MNTQTHDLTLHQVDDDLYKLMVAEAQGRGWSVNTTVKSKLRESYGLGIKKKKKRDLSQFFGSWSKEEADEFDRIIEETSERIDPEDWK